MDLPQTEVHGIRKFLSGRRGRDLREYLTAYLMVAPALILIFTFGIFPVFFALYVSMHKWRIKRTDFVGIANYLRAVDNIAFLVLFALGIAALVWTYKLLQKSWQEAEAFKEQPWLLIIPGGIYTATVFAFIRWAFLQLPEVLNIADKIIGVEKTRELFIALLKEAFKAESVLPTARLTLVLGICSIIVGTVSYRVWRNPRNLVYQSRFGITLFACASGILLLWYTYSEIMAIYSLSIETGNPPAIWSQIITITTGILLLAIAWRIWRSAEHQSGNTAFWGRILAGIGFMAAGWLLIAEIPMIVAAGDKDMWVGLKVTIFYSLGTVPFQLSISLFLAILLFQKMRGSELFRVIFFLPYVTPAVASATVFRQLFSNRLQAPINAGLRAIGLEPQQWLRESSGIFSMMAESIGVTIPDWAAGPSMALTVVMIFSIWTFVGYDIVIYLAGLGNIPQDLVESAEIDGAGKWDIFRHITFPLLSPTTYFLSLIAIIGTFKAFNHIWVLRQGEALGTVDTFSVVIFNEFFDKVRYGYASALAFVLFGIILSLTYVNNKIQGSRVFYG
ncbi:MAG: ABC transporter permease subunit [Anaerolineae bacterium]|nr:ABC transporter permease subunit [Anaerolineae bacterium]